MTNYRYYIMKKSVIFLLTSIILTIILVLNTISSNMQNEKSELILKEIKRTQDYNVNLATAMKFYQQAIIFFDIENLSDYHNCNIELYQDYQTCKSLESVNTLDRKKITDEMKYFYFNDTFIKTINKKSEWIFWIDFAQYILLIIALLGGFYIFLSAKDKDF